MITSPSSAAGCTTAPTCSTSWPRACKPRPRVISGISDRNLDCRDQSRRRGGLRPLRPGPRRQVARRQSPAWPRTGTACRPSTTSRPSTRSRCARPPPSRAASPPSGATIRRHHPAQDHRDQGLSLTSDGTRHGLHAALVQPQDVQSLLNRKLEAGLAPAPVQDTHAVLRRALNQALRWGSVPGNVASPVAPPRVERRQVNPLTPDPARDFLAVVGCDRLEALYSVAPAVGLRKGEASGLRWEGIDLDAGLSRLRAALQRIGGMFQPVEPKTAKSRRTIALPESAVAASRAHRARQLQERRLAGSRRPESGLVFTLTVGTPPDGATSTGNSRSHWGGRACHTYGSTTCDTPAPPSCWHRVFTRESRWTFSGTARSA